MKEERIMSNAISKRQRGFLMDPKPDPQSSVGEKTVSHSKVELSQLMQTQDANLYGNVHGGTIMRLIDNAASIPAFRHSHHNVVTASVDRIDFLSPVYIGNLLTLKASINFVARTSMEVGVRVEAECLQTGVKTHCASAFLTYVALDEKGKPCEIPKIIPESAEEKRRFADAQKRYEDRKQRKNKLPEQPPRCVIPHSKV